MDLTVSLLAPCDPEQLFYWVGTLERYPEWLGIVSQVVPDTTPESGDPSNEAAWLVDIAAKVGPFTRSKRLRMVQTVFREPYRVVYERIEHDDREHGEWILKAEIAALAESRSQLEMTLNYNGKLWGSILEPILADEIERSKKRLLALITA